MSVRGCFVWLFAVGACEQSGALIDASTIDSLPQQTITDTQTLVAGMLLEGSWLAGPSDQVGLTLGTTVTGLDWDIHGHAGGGTQEVASGLAQMTVLYDFRPTQQAQWYLLLRNSSTATLTIDINMDLFGQARWIGWQ